ncbi:MAG: hypothetical protein IKT55_05670 [Clostridia bacterium]|nr:hypothetical protein [Clostridia bacterium]
MNDNFFYNSLAEELNNIIDEELSKNYEDINAELIDDCCLALSEIYELLNGNVEASEKIININTVIAKYNLHKRKKLAVSAACAAVAVLSLGTTFVAFGNKTMIVESEIVKYALGKLENVFNATAVTTTEPVTEETTLSTTAETTVVQTTEPLTTPITIEVKNINVYPPPGFNSSVESAEDINLKDFYIRVNYTNGEWVMVPISEGRYEIGKVQKDGTTEIRIYYQGFTTSYYVTVEPEEPLIVTSIYGTFANEYTVEDMSVIAVYSDGTEKWIPKSECKITTEDFTDGDETGVIVTVEYQGCSFQFLSE